MIQYQAEARKEDGTYQVYFPDLPGCLASGKTREEALSEAREVLSCYLSCFRELDKKITPPKKRTGKKYLCVSPSANVGTAFEIRKARLEKKLSQNQMAKKLGIVISQFQNLENPSKSNPTVGTLEKVAAALGARLRIEFE
jgi:antitoxin HicB